MSNIFFGLNIGRSSLLAHQTALDVTGHNLANVQTEGYSRQRVALTASLPIQSPQGPEGSGVNADRIQRLQLGYLDRQMGKANTQHSYDAALVQGYDELQGVLGEPSSNGLGTALTEFWNSWEALSARPSDASVRAQVIDRSQHLALVFNQKMDALDDAEARFSDQIGTAVSDVNSWAQKIASLNVAIAQSEATGYTANDLRDQRDLLSQQIAGELGVEVETDGSQMNLRLPNGGPYLVSRSASSPLEVVRDVAGQITGLQLGSAAATPTTGEVGALFELRSSAVPQLRDGLTSLLATVTDRVNALHHEGYDRDNVQGLNLFQWQGEATATAFAPSSGLRGVTVDPGLEPGTHYLTVSGVTLQTGTTNGRGTIPAGGRSIGLGVAYADPSNPMFTGPMAINLDYHVRVVSPNVAAGDATGLRIQLFRGDEAVGEALAVTNPQPATVTWPAVDGLVFTATVDTAGQTFSAGTDRTEGYATVGDVSLDGGPAQAVDLTTGNNVGFAGGADLGYLGSGSMAVNFSGAPFSGASVTRYGSSSRLAVNPIVAADTDRVAAAAPLAGAVGAAAGDGEIARRIGELATAAIFEDVGDTVAGTLGRTAQTLGSKARDAQIFEKASASVQTQLEAQRQSEVGVNVDEEMVQMMQYQRGFQAAARFLSTVDGLIDTLINGVGAGR
ncbi:MAG: flagellar hook-associated protein FlgK [Deltaproteobacteria bacterium]|nr:flagellar hook-associated protein FlgK [Deltaproteobacteria bacterium]